MAFKPEQNSFATYKKVNNLNDGSNTTRMREEVYAFRCMQPGRAVRIILFAFYVS